MFTTIMYGFINEVTRQPGTAEIPLRANRGGEQGQSVARSRRKIRQAANATRRHRHLASKYRVLADSFKCAAGFY
jgi:hypothetical protein